MKKIDKILYLIIYSVIFAVMCRFPQYSFQLAIVLVGFLYSFFLMCHFGLMFPLFYIITFVSDKVNEAEFIKRLKEVSEVLSFTALFLINLVVILLIYAGIPCMLVYLYELSDKSLQPLLNDLISKINI